MYLRLNRKQVIQVFSQCWVSEDLFCEVSVRDLVVHSNSNDIDDFLVSVKEYNFQEAEMLGEFVDFQRNLLMYGIDFELRNEVE